MSSMTDTEPTTLSWGDDEKAPIRSVQELDERLDALDRQAEASQPFIAELVRPDGAVLSLGVGREYSVLNYSASPDPPYYTSHSADGGEAATVVFYYYGHESEFPGDAAVPMSDAREAARRFFVDGQRPDNLDWQQD